MSQEAYNNEKVRQLKNAQREIEILANDYAECSDDICKSQIKTFLEKKEHLLLNLLKEE